MYPSGRSSTESERKEAAELEELRREMRRIELLMQREREREEERRRGEEARREWEEKHGQK